MKRKKSYRTFNNKLFRIWKDYEKDWDLSKDPALEPPKDKKWPPFLSPVYFIEPPEEVKLLVIVINPSYSYEGIPKTLSKVFENENCPERLIKLQYDLEKKSSNKKEYCTPYV